MTRRWLVLLLILIAGCTSKSEVDSLKQEILSLNAQIESLKSDYDELKVRLDDFESGMSDMRLDMLIAGPQKTILLDWATGGYQKIDTDVGYFLISLDDVTPYLDGKKVKLRIGNPSTATFKGFDLEFKWGQKYDSKKKQPYDEWKKALNRKTVSFTKSLNPGTWNRTEAVLAPASIEQLQYIEMSMNVNTLSLRGE